MSVRSLAAAWNRFFFAPQSPIPLALFRILYGLSVMSTLLLLWPDWLNWFGAHGWVSLSTMFKMAPGPRLNIFNILPSSDRSIEALFWVSLTSAALLTLGVWTRMSSVVTFICLTSLHQRNLFITHSGDTFLRVTGFFLMFAPAGAALSIDRLLRVRRGKESLNVELRSPWAQRMIQFELSLLYLVTFCWKAAGDAWVNGTALYYVYHLNELRRFPVPAFLQYPLVLKWETWLTLALEFSLGVLIWFKELRYPLLLTGLLFHLFIEYSLNVPMFEWDILPAYVLFIDAKDLTRAGNWVRNRVWPDRSKATPLPGANHQSA